MKRCETFRREDMLKELCKVYISPTADIVQHFQDIQDKVEEKRKRTASSYRSSTARSSQPFISFPVTHTKQLYVSAATSKKILNVNRNVYSRMSSTMRQLEWEKYFEQASNVRKNKKKLDTLRLKTRQSPIKPGIWKRKIFGVGKKDDNLALLSLPPLHSSLINNQIADNNNNPKSK